MSVKAIEEYKKLLQKFTKQMMERFIANLPDKADSYLTEQKFYLKGQIEQHLKFYQANPNPKFLINIANYSCMLWNLEND